MSDTDQGVEAHDPREEPSLPHPHDGHSSHTLLHVERTAEAARQSVAAWQKNGEHCAFVPTMGALHAGHLRLVEKAHRCAQRVVVSIFVNPAQFGPEEDFHRYPRDAAGDRSLLAQAGVDLLYAPSVETMYLPGDQTRIDTGALGAILEGEARPGFFRGVATVVVKLLMQLQPDTVLFGEKDYQQLQVIRRVCQDLFLPVTVTPVPTWREEDGLAFSSRNVYLSASERAIAPALYRVLCAAALRYTKGERAAQIEEAARQELLHAGFTKIDYVTLCCASSLLSVAEFEKKALHLPKDLRLLAAAWLGQTRLIDNISVTGELPSV